MDRTLLDSDIRHQTADVGHRSSYSLKSVVSGLLSVVRYRFLLFAGIFPYILGSVIAYQVRGDFHFLFFSIGFVGIALTLVGVEILNEHFDHEKGGDRAFMESKPEVPKHYLKIGLIVFLLAFFIALYLTAARGWPIIIFAISGALAAIFYVAPPIQWSYRGLGEFMIFLSYGPLMTLGSYYLQAQRLDYAPLLASLVPGFLVLGLALINEIPDYYGDRLVGKKNLVVRMGRKKTVRVYGIVTSLCFVMVILGVFFMNFPPFSLLILLAVPLLYRSFSTAREYYDSPKSFLPAIRGTILLYLVVLSLMTMSYLVDRWI